MTGRDNEQLTNDVRMIHRQVSSVMRMLGFLLVCIIGGGIILADKDVVVYLVLALSLLTVMLFFHIDKLGYILVKYVIFNGYEIRYLFGKNFDDFMNGVDEM